MRTPRVDQLDDALGGSGPLAERMAAHRAGEEIPPERLEVVAHHYELIGGRSPLNELTFRQAEALRRALGTLPVYVDDSMRALCGASVISEFLDETHGVLKRDRRLLAEDPFQRAEIRRLTEWFMQKMEQDVTRPLARAWCQNRRRKAA